MCNIMKQLSDAKMTWCVVLKSIQLLTSPVYDWGSQVRIKKSQCFILGFLVSTVGGSWPLMWTLYQLESAEDNNMKDYSPFAPQRNDATSTPSSLYMESCELSDFLFGQLKVFGVIVVEVWRNMSQKSSVLEEVGEESQK